MNYFGNPWLDEEIYHPSPWDIAPPSFYPQPQIHHPKPPKRYPHRHPAASAPRQAPSPPAPPAKWRSQKSPPRHRRSRVIPVSSGDDDHSGAKKSFEIKTGSDAGRKSRNQDRRAAAVPAISLVAAAIRIQKAFRGFLVRRDVRRISQAAAEVDELQRLIVAEEGRIRSDPMERLRLNEILMKLVLRLDSIHRARDYRRKVVRRAISLQDLVDSLAEQSPAMAEKDSKIVRENNSDSPLLEVANPEEVPQENDSDTVSEEERYDLDEGPAAKTDYLDKMVIFKALPEEKQAASLELISKADLLDDLRIGKEAASLEEIPQEEDSKAFEEEKAVPDVVPVAKQTASLEKIPQEDDSKAFEEEKAVPDVVPVAKQTASLEKIPQEDDSKAFEEEKAVPDVVPVAKQTASLEEMPQESNLKAFTEDKADVNDVAVPKEATYVDEMPQDNSLDAEISDLDVVKDVAERNNIAQDRTASKNNDIVKDAGIPGVLSAVPFAVEEALQVEDLERESSNASTDGFEALGYTRVEHEQEDGILGEEDFVYLSDEDGLDSYSTSMKTEVKYLDNEAAPDRLNLDDNYMSKYRVEKVVENERSKSISDKPASVEVTPISDEAEKFLENERSKPMSDMPASVEVPPIANQVEPMPTKLTVDAGNSTLDASEMHQVVQKVMSENKRLQQLVEHLCESYIKQSQLLNSLTDRVEYLEQKMQSEKKKKKK